MRHRCTGTNILDLSESVSMSTAGYAVRNDDDQDELVFVTKYEISKGTYHRVQKVIPIQLSSHSVSSHWGDE